MNTELYNQLAQADSVCKQVSPYLENAEKLEAQAASAAAVRKVGFVWAGIGIGTAIFYVFGMIGTLLHATVVSMVGVAAGVVGGIFSAKAFIKMKRANAEEKAKAITAQANEQRAQAQQIFEENYDTISVLPADYWYPMATEYIARAVQTGRANTIPEALAMYDEQLHRWKMENAQMEILAEQQAQTAQLRSIKTSSAVSAGANVANAAANIARWF